MIEDKAIAVPCTVIGWDVLEILKDTAFEVIDVFKAVGEHIARGFFAANAACAVHCDFLIFRRVELFFDPFGEFGEDFGVWIDCPFECTELGLVIIARIKHDYVRIIDEVVPIFGRDILSLSLIHI